MLPLTMPLKAKMLPERGSTSKASGRNDHFFFNHSRSLSALKDQNRAKAYLRGTLSQYETWLVSCIFFQMQPQCSNRHASVLWRQKAQAVWPHQREGPWPKRYWGRGSGGGRNDSPKLGMEVLNVSKGQFQNRPRMRKTMLRSCKRALSPE